MPFGDKGVLGTVVSALVGVNHRVEEAAESAVEALGDKLFGSTAESETKKAEIIAPEASTEPDTVGRRSKAPDGKDSYRKAKDSEAEAEAEAEAEDEDEDKA